MRTENMKKSAEMLDKVNIDAIFKYLDREPIKGDSWREMSINKMVEIMNSEIEEFKAARKREYWSKTFSQTDSYQEILDIINTAKMVGALIKESEKNE